MLRNQLTTSTLVCSRNELALVQEGMCIPDEIEAAKFSKRTSKRDQKENLPTFDTPSFLIKRKLKDRISDLHTLKYRNLIKQLGLLHIKLWKANREERSELYSSHK